MATENKQAGGPVALTAARTYVAAGISVIPIGLDGEKRPFFDRLPQVHEDGKIRGVWRDFKRRLPTDEELKGWFDCRSPSGIAAVGGRVSGNLECIDFDAQADVNFPLWRELVEAHAPGLLQRLTVHKSPEGYHVIYRCPGVTIDGSKLLAADPAAPLKAQTLIETRGEAGYWLVPGSPPSCHKTKRPWRYEAGPRLSQVLEITPEEREILWAAARVFDLRPPETRRRNAAAAGGQLKPIDDFKARGPKIIDLLPEGWHLVRTVGRVQHYERPDKEQGTTSATLGFLVDDDGNPLWYPFTSNCAPFRHRRFHDNFGVYVAVKHNGDMKAAISDIVKQGYGKPVKKEESEEEEKKKPKKLLPILLEQEFELFNTPKRETYIALEVNDAKHCWEVGGRDFEDWASDCYYETTGQGASESGLKEAARVLRCRSRKGGLVHNVFTRCCRIEDKVYVDLANKAGQCVEIDAQGWRVLAAGPVRWQRNGNTFALATPVAGGYLGQLRELLNLDGDASWHMLVAFMAYAWYGVSDYPCMTLSGEHGSAKTTAAEIVKKLVDNNEASLLPVPKDDSEFLFAARAGLLLVLDNVSYLDQSQSDALCRLSTGGGSVRKKLYTDADICTSRIMRPVILTALTDVVTADDLLDRSITVRSVPIPSERRVSKAVLWQGYAQAEGEIIGALCDGISGAMRILPTVCPPGLPRLSDYGVFGEAFWRAQGLPPGRFLEALAANAARNQAASIESSPIAELLIDLVHTRLSFRGPASDLLSQLEYKATDVQRKLRSWPKKPDQLTKQIDKLKPVLRQAGIQVTSGQTDGRNSRRFISLSLLENDAPHAPHAPQKNHNPLPAECLLETADLDPTRRNAPHAPQESAARAARDQGDAARDGQLDAGAENVYYW